MKKGTEIMPTIVAKTPKERRTSGKMIHSMSPVAGVDGDAEDHGADVLGGHGLEEVGATAGAVADVVADEVGDDGGVARVVFGDAGLDLADEVGADVGGLGVDTAAELGEQRHEAGAEAEADDEERRNLRSGCRGRCCRWRRCRDADEAQRHDEEAGDGATAQRRP